MSDNVLPEKESSSVDRNSKDHELNEFLSNLEILSCFDRPALNRIAAAGEKRFYKFGEAIANAGDKAKGIYCIKTGAARLFIEENGKETSQGVRKAGEVFSEIGMLRDQTLEYSVRSSGKTEIIFIAKEAFTDIFQQNDKARSFVATYAAIASAGGLVNRLFDLRGKVDKSEIAQVVATVGVKRMKAGSVILQQDGKEDRRLYVVRQGQVQLTRNEEGNEYTIASLKKGEVFGEKACLLRQEQMMTATASQDSVLLVIPEKTVHFILERNNRLGEALEQRISFYERELERQKKLSQRRRLPEVFDLWSKPGMGERVIKRFPLVEQAEEMDCGAACLAMICKYYKIPLTLGKLREMANVTTEGATLESLAKVGDSLGFNTRGIQCTYESLLGFQMPFIAHWEGYHYIIVYGVSKKHVWVADPGPGFRKMTVEEFEKGWSGTCLLFDPGNDLAQPEAGQSPWIRFIHYLQPYKKILLHLFLATFIIQMLGIIPPVIIQNILDRVIVHANVNLLNLLIVGFIITNLFTQVSTVLRSFLMTYMVRNMDFSMMSHFFKHAMSLPISFFSKRKTGDIFARFQENQTIRSFLTGATVSTILNLLMVFIYFTILFLYNVTLTSLLIAMVIPIILLTVLVTPKLKSYARETFTASTDADSVLMETLGGAETIKAMGMERTMRIKWEKKYVNSLNVQYRSQRFGIWVGFISQLLNSMITVVILWIGATQVLSNELTIGQLMAFNALMGSVLAPLMGLVGLWNQIHSAGVAMERLGDVLDMEPEQKPEDIGSRVMLPELQGDIQFDQVYFRYGDSGDYILENISFDIKAGEMVAIVGQSGSGKTTLAKMLVGFFNPTEGKINVDGYDLKNIDKEFYRSRIGYVMQSNLLFSGSIAENIAAGDNNPDLRRVMEVCKMADAHDFISAMPLGYEQVVGERGMGLSGGQMQRVCIARALYHDPRLLIFDEATSALDTQAESNILENMKNIMQDKTSVVIAHRLSTIMQADKILVLYKGALVEQGNHQELLDRKGMYYQLVQKQISEAP